MLQTMGAAAAGGLISALLYLLVATGGMGGLMLGYLAPLPIFAAGFGLGRNAVAMAAVVGAAGTAVLSGSGFTVLAYALTVALPVVVTVRSAILVRTGEDGKPEWFPPGRLLVRQAGLAIAGLLAAAVLASGEPDGLEGVLRAALSELGRVLAQADTGLDQELAIVWVSSIVPGLTGVSWLVMMAVNGLLAQGVLTRLKLAIRPTPCLRDIELPRWTDIAFAVCVAGAFLPDPFGFVALNAALILGSLFGFTGLATVHAYARSRPSRPVLLGAFYAVVILLGWPILLVIGLGLIEQWMGLRRRWSVGPHRGDE
jgi:hypothetical protein